jgi:hypothetical protein
MVGAKSSVYLLRDFRALSRRLRDSSKLVVDVNFVSEGAKDKGDKTCKWSLKNEWATAPQLLTDCEFCGVIERPTRVWTLYSMGVFTGCVYYLFCVEWLIE